MTSRMLLTSSSSSLLATGGPRRLRPTVLVGALGSASLVLASCSSGSDGLAPIGGVSTMKVESCVLGCTGPAEGPLSCSITSVFVNQDFWVQFSKPVDLGSVDKSSFQLVNSATGIAPSGSFLLDPTNDRRVIFRPKLTFDASGSPSFGLSQGAVYRLRVPGELDGGDGPYITSIDGIENQVEIDCFVNASLGVKDIVSGPPTVTGFIDVFDAQGQVVDTLSLESAVDVPVDSRLRFTFNDVMNPAALVNPTTKESATIRVLVDLDGNISLASDQIPLDGAYDILVDEAGKTTTVFFDPAGNFPSAGLDPDNPRKIIVELPTTIVDLGGNPIDNPGNRVFQTVFLPQPPETITEDFDDTALLDAQRTSTLPDPGAQTIETVFDDEFQIVDTFTYAGRVIPGLGGGSGRLGDLVILNGETVVLSTGPDVPTVFGPELENGPVDEEGDPVTFDEEGEPSAEIVAWHVKTDLIDNYASTMEPAGSSTVTISDGAFDFASLTLNPGARIEFVGDNPPRFFVRGEAKFLGLLDVAGGDALPHDSAEGFGGPGGEAGPNGGAGGAGGDRPDNTGNEVASGGSLLGFEHEPGAIVSTDGRPGVGRGGEDPIGGNDFGAGGGGTHWPLVYPGPDKNQLNGFEPNEACESVQVGAPGAGGSFAFFGTGGEYLPPNPTIGLPVFPPLATPGSSLLKAADALLDPDKGGLLIGGAGGAGGGGGIARTRSNGFPLAACLSPSPGSTELALLTYRDHSGSGGGGGGGTAQIQAGSLLRIDGKLDVSGGAGGGPDNTQAIPSRYAAPGGGGSGGSLLLQSLDVQVTAVPGVIDIAGGPGGFNGVAGAELRGGEGGPGVVQIQKSPLVDLPPTVVDQGILAFPLEVPDDADVSDYLSISNWSPVLNGFGAATGYQSCWLAPSGQYFNVNYIEDDLSSKDPSEHVYGWNMKVQLVGVFGVTNFRGDSGLVTLFQGADLESLLGNDIGISPIVVRFQGARSNSPIEEPCFEDPTDPDSLIISESVTPWLNSPGELNTYWSDLFPENPSLAASLRPNLVRVQIVFDRRAPNFNLVESVVQFSIEVQPD